MEKDSIECCIYFSPGGGAVKRFIDFYNAFSIFKGVALANAEKLYAFHLAGALIISEVRGNDASTCYAMHCYVTDGVSARLYYSATLPRKNANDAINFDYQLLGRANKLLHWKTMLAMKNHGLNFYDFGGIANTTELKGIDDFKRQFGGLKIVHYNDLVPVSVVGRLALFFYGLIKSLF
jgi:hypothetical protein